METPSGNTVNDIHDYSEAKNLGVKVEIIEDPFRAIEVVYESHIKSKQCSKLWPNLWACAQKLGQSVHNLFWLESLQVQVEMTSIDIIRL